MKGRRIINFDELWSIAVSRGWEIWVSVISFWKSNIEATEVLEAVEVIDTAEVLRPGKSLLKYKESFRFLNLGCFEKKRKMFESWNIILNFSTFSVRGYWGQPMSLFGKLDDETQISKPPEPAMDLVSIKSMILLPLIAI